ncbi:hypothetical protein NQ315_015088 [Exocentrus adspersus]|uniref:Uncharacterized protein n=1 Tax=Exocentrus adspersus TaxID=1586481 RepID=A0AAV8VWX8_9CUCU|nr:hypothetical protein NQ315_015088 [Exocentrus adspersus]
MKNSRFLLVQFHHTSLHRKIEIMLFRFNFTIKKAAYAADICLLAPHICHFKSQMKTTQVGANTPEWKKITFKIKNGLQGIY